jgi:polysaccharide pyruvyl transferase WcaK-like protein
MNKGDFAILKSEVSVLQKIYANAEISIFTLYPEELRRLEPTLTVYPPLIDLKVRRHRAPLLFSPIILILQLYLAITSIALAKAGLKSFYRPKVAKALIDADLIMSQGAQPFMADSVYHEGTSLFLMGALYFNLFWGTFEILIAKKLLKTPFATFPQSVGPFRTFPAKLMAKLILRNLDAVLLRESSSLAHIKDLKVSTPTYLLADVAFLFESKPGPNNSGCKFGLRRPIVGVSPCMEYIYGDEYKNYLLVHAKVLDFLVVQFGFSVVFLPHHIGRSARQALEQMDDDLISSEQIMLNMVHQEKARIISVENVEEYKCCLGLLDLLISTRMHPTILASLSFVPFVSIIHEHKQVGLLENLSLHNVGLSIHDLSYQALLTKVEFVWRNKEGIAAKLESRVPELQERTRNGIYNVLSNFFVRD